MAARSDGVRRGLRLRGRQVGLAGSRLDYEGDADLVGRHLDPARTCRVDEPLDEVRRRLGPDLEGCIVIADSLAIGVLDAGAAGRTAGDAMSFGVSTVRPSEEASALRHRMAHRGADQSW